MIRGLRVAAALACLMTLGACTGPRTFDGPVYPSRVESRSVVDIQVRRNETKITMTNTTAHSFGPGTLWANASFALPIDGLAIGQTLRLDLRDFRNEFNEPFRGGGFFATARPDDLVLMELELEGQMVGFVVIGQDNPEQGI